MVIEKKMVQSNLRKPGVGRYVRVEPTHLFGTYPGQKANRLRGVGVPFVSAPNKQKQQPTQLEDQTARHSLGTYVPVAGLAQPRSDDARKHTKNIRDWLFDFF